MRPWKSRAGQIVIPAMLLFPTLFLFVYLIYDRHSCLGVRFVVYEKDGKAAIKASAVR